MTRVDRIDSNLILIHMNLDRKLGVFCLSLMCQFVEITRS